MEKSFDFEYFNDNYPYISFDKKYRPLLLRLLYCLDFENVDSIIVVYQNMKIVFDDFNKFNEFVCNNSLLEVDSLGYTCDSINFFCHKQKTWSGA